MLVGRSNYRKGKSVSSILISDNLITIVIYRFRSSDIHVRLFVPRPLDCLFAITVKICLFLFSISKDLAYKSYNNKTLVSHCILFNYNSRNGYLPYP